MSDEGVPLRPLPTSKETSKLAVGFVESLRRDFDAQRAAIVAAWRGDMLLVCARGEKARDIDRYLRVYEHAVPDGVNPFGPADG